MQALYFVILVCVCMQLSAMFIRTPTTPEPDLDNDIVNGSLYINVEKPQQPADLEFPKKHDGSFIGFTAWKESTQDFETGDVIIFDGVTVNEGGYYEPALSRFTCPFDGVYYVAYTYQCADALDFIYLYVPDDYQDLDSFNYHADNPNNVNSNSFIISCQQGHEISVIGSRSGAVFGELGLPRSTFTVFMMYQQGLTEEKHDSFIGFSAYPISTPSYAPGDVVVFGGVWLNEGNNYDPSRGRFQCPVTGIYLVVGHFMRYSTYSLHLGVDKDTITILYSDGISTLNKYNTLSNLCVIRCIGGEVISVKATGEGSLYGYYSSFSVMLLSQDAVSSRHQAFVGFTAYKKYTQSYTDGDTIAFEGVLLNEGEKYQPVTSRFSCDVTGIYFVALTSKKASTSDMEVDVRVGSIIVIRVSDLQTTNPENTVSNSALVRCFSGEDISVVGVGSGVVHGDTSKSLSTFTAFLMYEY